MLSLPEQLLLLALHDEKGTILSSASMSIRYGLAGAIIMELALREKVEIRDKKLVLVNDSYTGDSVLDEAMALMKNLGKGKNAGYWVNKLTSKIKIQEIMLERLVDKGILKTEEHKILWIFDSPHYPMKDSGEEFKIREHIRRIILHNDTAEARVAVLIGLVNACRLTNEIFSKQERKDAKKRIKEIMENDLIAKAVADTVVAIEAALMVVIFAGAATTTINS